MTDQQLLLIIACVFIVGSVVASPLKDAAYWLGVVGTGFLVASMIVDKL
jgi:hypothetical protein